MCDRGASYVVKQMRRSSRCGLAVASDCAVRCSFNAVRFILWMKEKILWMKEKYTLVW